MSRWPLWLGSAAIFALAGCYFQPPPQTRYYTLDYAPNPTPERLEKGTYPYTVRVRDFNISEAYRRSQIVYRQSPHLMQFYNFHLWSVDPERMISDLVIKHLRAVRLFENITRTVESYMPDFYLGADILAIEEYDSKEIWYAHLAIDYKLEDARTNQVVWKKTFDLRKKVSQQEPIYLVREISFLLETMNERMVQEIEIILDEYQHKAKTPEVTSP